MPPVDTALAIVKTLESEDRLLKIADALPEHSMSKERFARIAVMMCTRPELRECTHLSLVKGVMQAAQLGLELDGVLGHAYLLPFGKEATFVPGYRGLIELALRTGKVSHVEASVVYKGDEFYFQKGLDPKLEHVPTREIKERGDVTAAYAVVIYLSGQKHFEVMERVELDAVQNKSPGARSGKSPWTTHPQEMQKKTVLKRLLKITGLSPEITRGAVMGEYQDAGVFEQPKRPIRVRLGRELPTPEEAEKPAPTTEEEQPPPRDDDTLGDDADIERNFPK